MNVVEICNLSLSLLGVGPIASLQEQTAQAQHCRVFYDQARDATLAARWWAFASAAVDLVQRTSGTFPGWACVYGHPDALTVRKVGGTEIFTGEPSQDFRVYVDTGDGLRKIATNVEGAKAEVTAKIMDPTLFEPLFVDALVWRLAAYLAIPLRGDPKMQELAFNNFRVTLSEGHAKSAGQTRVSATTGKNPYLDARR